MPSTLTFNAARGIHPFNYVDTVLDPINFPGLGLITYGTGGDDVLQGTKYADEIHGRGGADRIYGGGGDDRLFGGEGMDFIYGGHGNDIIDGGPGDDRLVGGTGADHFVGGDGFDTVEYITSEVGESAISINLATGTGNGGLAQGDTFTGIERIRATNHADFLVASDTGSVLDGHYGNDNLIGGLGNDVLIGGYGNDHLDGGAGFDVLTGGEGRDWFVIRADEAADLITDYEPSVDVLQILFPAQSFAGSPFGNDGELLTGTDVSMVTSSLYGFGAGDRLFYDSDDYQLYRLGVGDDGAVEATLLATFGNGVQLAANDIVFG